jgi:predicted enzyme related to lactoylglutathione lyase
MKVLSLQNAHYSVRDMDRARAFYETLLGAEPAFSDGAQWTQFKVAGRGFALSSGTESVEGQAGAVLVIEVDDLEAAEAEVTSLGGSVLDTRDMGSHGSVLTFRDPDGNLVQLFARARQ